MNNVNKGPSFNGICVCMTMFIFGCTRDTCPSDCKHRGTDSIGTTRNLTNRYLGLELNLLES